MTLKHHLAGGVAKTQVSRFNALAGLTLFFLGFNQGAMADNVCSDRHSDAGWSELHKAVETGDLPEVRSLIAAGYAIDERIAAGDELHRLYEYYGPPAGEALFATLPDMRDLNEATVPVGRDDEETDRDFDRFEQAAEEVVRVLNMFLCEDATVLHIAAVNGYVELVEFLLNEGLDAGARTRTGAALAPIDMAAMGNAPDVIRVLVEHGANVDLSDEDAGPTFGPLHWSAVYDALEAAAGLLRAGANANSPSRGEYSGITPMDLLQGRNENYLFRMLLEAYGGQCAMNCDALVPGFEGLSRP